jgi:hypothetical protein
MYIHGLVARFYANFAETWPSAGGRGTVRGKPVDLSVSPFFMNLGMLRKVAFLVVSAQGEKLHLVANERGTDIAAELCFSGSAVESLLACGLGHVGSAASAPSSREAGRSRADEDRNTSPKCPADMQRLRAPPYISRSDYSASS